MAFLFSNASLKNLEGVHPDLVKLARRALELTQVDFRVTDGLRTLEEQQQLLAAGKSTTMRSRHLTGHAIDVVALPNNRVSWDWEYYEMLAEAFKQASVELGIPVEWGGDWKTFRDGPHFQLPRTEYPA